ncbi:hypothetical protein EUX98_g5175 [Antrodiella citrinella]|uniref:Uncharacterized protein n=1 Tax=Antrodiella citrinella TaxID=2447956 RepID=A0A4S4MU28_9APHY|nr:hypothetical protein EUX98_g5175 [Antrodiella citrinella]
MNFTLDDTSSQLDYTPGAWAVQPPSDTQRTQFFQDTYHSAQEDGAQLNMSINGLSFYLYGSKGLGHGNFSVQYDDTIIFLSAYADASAFQQLLFSHTFDPNSTSPHFVSLTARLTGSGVRGSWLDIDYVTFTSPSSSTSPLTVSSGATVLPTVVPPWVSEPPPTSTSAAGSSATTNASASPPASTSSSSSKTSSKVPVALAAVFGSIIALVILGAVIYYVLRRIHDSRRARERNFRMGNSSAIMTPSIATRNGSTTLLTLAPPGGDSSAGGKANNTHTITPPSSPGFGDMVSGAGAGGEAEDKAVSTASSASAGASAVPLLAAPPSMPFAFLASSPISFNLTRKHKGDADSLRTDFLQV